MVEFIPPGDSAAQRIIVGILDAFSNSRDLPSAFLIDDGGGSWKRHAALLPVEQRRRAVVAALTETSLIDAVRFEIGGASWLPASTPSIEMACEAAVIGDRGECAPIATRGVLETLIADANCLSIIGWRPRAFWSRQLGSPRLCTALTEVAHRLECVPAILPGPVLVVTGCEREAIEAGCREYCESEKADVQVKPEILDLTATMRSKDPTLQVENLLASLGQAGDSKVNPLADAQPVLNLTTGERVGCWSVSGGESNVKSGWMARPSEDRRDGGAWDIDSADGSRTVMVERTSMDDQDSSKDTVIRVPGFIGAELRLGSPAGLLVERWAEHPAREDRPIWVPSVDTDGVRFLLGLPGPIWVDGPGVPG